MKRILSFALVLVTLFTVICCSFNAFAVNETITVIPTKSGALYQGETKKFKFSIPALAKVSINFTGATDVYYDGILEDIDFDKATYGCALIKIENVVDGTWVYSESADISYDDTKFNVTLPKGDYALYFITNKDSDDLDLDYDDLDLDYDLDLDDDYDYEDLEYDYDYDDLDYDYDYYEFQYCFNVTAKLLEEVQYTSLSLNKSKATLSVNKSLQLSEKHEPASATFKPKWTTSNKNVATVNADGKVTAKALGTAIITAKLGDKSDSCVINVTSNNSCLNVLPGKASSIKSAFNNISGYKKAKYSSSNKKIATINSAGVIKGKKLGKVTITALINGVKYTQKVNVKNPSISLSKTSATLYKGDNKAVKSTTLSLKATTFPVNQKVTWKSSNTRIATVSKKGKITPVASGNVTIKATFKYAGKTYTKSCKVTVKLKRAVSTKVTKIENEAIYNDCYIKFANNSNKNITYITLNITQYDNRGYKLSSPYEYYYINDTLKANSSCVYSFWVNDDTKSAKVKITKVWFSDGSTYTPR